MKKVKRLFALVLAMLLLTSLVLPATAEGTSLASGTYTITIDRNDSTRSYKAYQIFTGDISSTELANVKWGDGITSEGERALITKFASNITGATAADVADAIKTESDAKEMAALLATVGYLQAPSSFVFNSTTHKFELSNLEAGYYMIVDDTNVADKNIAASAYMMRLVHNVTVSPKDSVPTLEKTVSDINDSTQIAPTTHLKSADYDIGDLVPFHLHIKLGDNIEQYESYKLVITDTLSKGLTYEGNMEVKYGTHTLTPDAYTVSTPVTNEDGESTFTITFGNLFDVTDTNGDKVAIHGGGNLIVNYDAMLNDQAVIGSAGNPNTASMTFSNNPNGEGEGVTPSSTAIVFTYKLVVNKVDQDNKPLTGAEFTLYKNDVNGEWSAISRLVTNTDQTEFTFNGLDDGEYKLVETKVPAGYNKTEDMIFKVEADHTTVLNTLTGEKVSGVIELSATESTGTLNTTVVNEKGATLPSTGGMGTTLFYLAGGILVCAAAVLLITKKRMGQED